MQEITSRQTPSTRSVLATGLCAQLWSWSRRAWRLANRLTIPRTQLR